MKDYKIHLLTAIAVLLMASPAMKAESGRPDPKVKAKVIRCDRHAASSFAIITDTKTYTACRQQLHAYRDILQEEGLGTYIVHADWQNPEQVKAQIQRLSSRRPALEGVVFIGEVPIVMVREAQWMTTAFKMNEKTWPVFESSVASDRFYDDFDLQFDYLGRDSLRQDTFYYRLSSRGAQTLRPDIYSARMKVPAQMKGDHDELMRRYLEKVVAAHKEQNCLDNMTFFAGHGYNSDCLTLWRQRPVVYREHFPQAFTKASGNRFLNFRQKEKMKDNLAIELQRPDCDFFQFSEHGAPDIQYINGSLPANSLASCYDHLKRSVASYYEQYKGTADDEPFLQEAVDSAYLLPRSAVSDSAMTVYQLRDSLEFRDANLYLDDLAGIRSEPRVIVLNACYNGSFHNEEGYVAGFHVFSDGRCVVAQGNTVNVLQDKWEDKLLGLLAIGERIGMWQKEITYLESHLIGDPTFRFTPRAEDQALLTELHHDLVHSPENAEVWKARLNDSRPLVRATAITHLSYCEGNWSCEALQLLQGDPSWTVRMSALMTLSTYMDENTVAGLETAFKDPYEVIQRHACQIAGASGDPRFKPMITDLLDRRKELARVPFIGQSALKIIDGKAFAASVDRIGNQDLSDTRHINVLRTFRNNRVVAAAAPLCALVRNPEYSEEVRQVAAEVLGWYDRSIARTDIIQELEHSLQEDVLPANVAEEVKKTLKRLQRK